MYENAKIESFLAEQDGTTLVIRVPNRYLGDFFYSHRIKDCEIRFNDGRTITNEQRKKAYATIRDIADWTGEPPEAMKEWLKYLHISRTGCRYFSLSNCSIDTAREYINTLLDYALENGIILLDFGVDRTDDIDRYLYSCLKNKRCAICGRDGEIHHVDTIGMGNNRRKLDDSKKRKICLCREHHTIAHTIGMELFSETYKVYGIIYNP